MINGERIRQARELRGFTQQGLAEQVGVNQSAIAQLEAGRTQPSPIVLQSISFATAFLLPSFNRGMDQIFRWGHFSSVLMPTFLRRRKTKLGDTVNC
jgi:transcriptional regulator with XRE-family HTH domain